MDKYVIFNKQLNTDMIRPLSKTNLEHFISRILETKSYVTYVTQFSHRNMYRIY